LINQGFYGNQKECVRYLSSVTLCRRHTFCYSFMVTTGGATDRAHQKPNEQEYKVNWRYGDKPIKNWCWRAYAVATAVEHKIAQVCYRTPFHSLQKESGFPKTSTVLLICNRSLPTRQPTLQTNILCHSNTA
jgi:hypothetical protein